VHDHPGGKLSMARYEQTKLRKEERIKIISK
jgi:hypothetical protein